MKITLEVECVQDAREAIALLKDYISNNAAHQGETVRVLGKLNGQPAMQASPPIPPGQQP